jgi:hypothetical protein
MDLSTLLESDSEEVGEAAGAGVVEGEGGAEDAV